MSSQVGPGGSNTPVRGAIILDSPFTFTPAAADTYEPLPGSWVGSGLDRLFSVDSSGIMTYSGDSGRVFLVNGAVVLSAPSLVDTVYLAAFVNGVVATNGVTSHTFTSASRFENMGVSAIALLNYGDVIQVYGKTTLGRPMYIEAMSTVLWG